MRRAAAATGQAGSGQGDCGDGHTLVIGTAAPKKKRDSNSYARKANQGQRILRTTMVAALGGWWL